LNRAFKRRLELLVADSVIIYLSPVPPALNEAPLPSMAVLEADDVPSEYFRSTLVGRVIGPDVIVKLAPASKVIAHSEAVSHATSFTQKSKPARKLH
jgi:hypothetical protein